MLSNFSSGSCTSAWKISRTSRLLLIINYAPFACNNFHVDPEQHIMGEVCLSLKIYVQQLVERSLLITHEHIRCSMKGLGWDFSTVLRTITQRKYFLTDLSNKLQRSAVQPQSWIRIDRNFQKKASPSSILECKVYLIKLNLMIDRFVSDKKVYDLSIISPWVLIAQFFLHSPRLNCFLDLSFTLIKIRNISKDVS